MLALCWLLAAAGHATSAGPPAPKGWLGPSRFVYSDVDCPNLGNFAGPITAEKCTELCDEHRSRGCDAVNFELS